MATAVFLVVIVGVSVCVGLATGLYIGDSCTVKSSGSPGKCLLLLDCRQAQYELQVLQRFPQTCGFEGTQPIVCCAVSTPGPTPAPVVTPTRTRKPGEVTKAKCREYAKHVFKTGRPPTLLIDADDTTRDECGFKVVTLIVGGELAKRKEFPHMAVIGFEPRPGDIRWSCGGTLISDRYILTAGHCLESREFGLSKYVKIGVTNLRDSNNLQQFNVVDRVPHPQYKPPSHYHDIALIKLNNQAKLNPYARPACLYTNTDITGHMAIASGWGKVDYAGPTSDDLMKVTLDFTDEAKCNYSYRNHVGRKLMNGIRWDIQLCAGSNDPEKEKDTCQGDSGGPLQIYHIRDDIYCMYDIIGVTSFGKPCGVGSSSGVYTRVSQYIQWIEDIVWP